MAQDDAPEAGSMSGAARGVVEVRGGWRLVVTTHASSRYALDFSNHSMVPRKAVDFRHVRGRK